MLLSCDMIQTSLSADAMEKGNQHTCRNWNVNGADTLCALFPTHVYRTLAMTLISHAVSHSFSFSLTLKSQ